jgi:hypothetical protein
VRATCVAVSLSRRRVPALQWVRAWPRSSEPGPACAGCTRCTREACIYRSTPPAPLPSSANVGHARPGCDAPPIHIAPPDVVGCRCCLALGLWAGWPARLNLCAPMPVRTSRLCARARSRAAGTWRLVRGAGDRSPHGARRPGTSHLLIAAAQRVAPAPPPWLGSSVRSSPHVCAGGRFIR